jgi:hypothetical protein
MALEYGGINITASSNIIFSNGMYHLFCSAFLFLFDPPPILLLLTNSILSLSLAFIFNKKKEKQ